MGNSSQINFFITPDDWFMIDEFMANQNCVCLANTNSIEELEVCRVVRIGGISESPQAYVTKEVFLDDVWYRKVEHSCRVDILKSCVVEFSRGGYYGEVENVLHIGRLYLVSRYYEENKLVAKNESFILWAKSFLQMFKKRFLVKSGFDAEIYFSKNAINWVKSRNASLHKSGLYVYC